MPIVKMSEQAKLLPKWELVIELDGKQYPTRRPTAAQHIELANLSKSLNYAAILPALNGLFEQPGPDVAAWPLALVQRFVEVFVAYAADYHRRCQPAGRPTKRAPIVQAAARTLAN